MNPIPKIAIFDLDHTLINADTAVLFNRFLYDKSLIADPEHLVTLERFNTDYHSGQLDCLAYQHFTMQIFPLHTLKQMQQIRTQFWQQVITERLNPLAAELVDKHRQQGDMTILISATNHFLTDLFCDYWHMDLNLSTRAEIIAGKLSGHVAGTPSFKAGKVSNIRDWLHAQQIEKAHCTCYSDSHNDLPLLRFADQPVAVNPDPTLRRYAEQHNWPILVLLGSCLI